MGKVKRINPAGFTKLSALGVEEQRVMVTIDFDHEAAKNLGVAYRLQAEFFVGSEKKHVLLLPRFSVLEDQRGNNYAVKMVKKDLQKQIVEVGINSDKEIEILSGLSSQDTVLAEPSHEEQY